MNKIKTRFVGAALAVIMGASALPANVMAASNNNVTRIATVKEDSIIKNVQLKIKPTSEVESGSSIILTLENAEFDEDKIKEKTGKSLEELTAYKDDGFVKPYEFEKVTDTEAQVFLGGITRGEADSDFAPYYLIPIVAIATSNDDVKVSIEANGTVISETTHTIATVTNKNGATTTTVNKTKTFSETLYVDTITVKEDIYNTFKTGEIKVRVNGGFKIVDTSNIKINAAINLKSVEDIEVDLEDGGQYFTFKLPTEWTNTTKASSFTITGIKIEPEDEDKDYGDVKLTISGSSANITKDTITVGTRQDYGFEFEVVDEVPTIISGRTYVEHRDLDEDDFKSATIKFAELTADTWIANRKLEFTVPEGVKIVDIDFDEIEEIKSLEDNVSITNGGQTIKIERGIEFNANRKDDDVASFEMNLYLSIDADFTGDIDLEVKGAGITEDSIPAITIAEAITPIKIDTSATTVNMGYQSFSVADITISETEDGTLLDGEEVIIAFDDKNFGNAELGFNDTDIKYIIEGELEIKNFEVNNGAISFKIDKTSYTEPSSITISNITVGTTRSVPYGSYSLKVMGDAIVNNYDKNIDDVYPVKLDAIDEKENEDIYYFDTIDGYAFDDYIKIITTVGTFDNVVEVTVGTDAIRVNEKEYNIDAISYIQASTNSTLIPLRAVAVALANDNIENADNSSKIAFDTETKTATVIYNGKIVQFQAGSAYMVVDGTTIANENGAIAEITADRMYVPMRSLGVALGIPVSWDAETRTARYN